MVFVLTNDTKNTDSYYKLVVYSDLNELNNIKKLVNSIVIVVLIFTGILAFVIGIFIARSITKPIIQIKRRTESISKREFDSKIKTIKTGDELETLAISIEKMARDLKEYDQSQMKLLQNASHELKAPLMSIKGYAEGIKDNVFEDDQKALDIIIDESSRLERIVKDIMFLSKLETLKDYYLFKPVSLDTIINDCISKIDSLMKKDKIKVELELSKGVTVYADREKLIQSMINILGNCIRHSKSLIKISSIIDNNMVDIIIDDDGDGFEESEIKFVFDRFFKGKKGNIGLGLAITKTIIQNHNGKIIVSNNLQGGARFVIKLPVL
jgi:signal transduction histidine kinase